MEEWRVGAGPRACRGRETPSALAAIPAVVEFSVDLRGNPKLREQFLEEGEVSDLDEAADRGGVADRDHPGDKVWMSWCRSSVVYPVGILRSPSRRSNARRDHPAKRHALATGRSPSDASGGPAPCASRSPRSAGGA